MSAPQLDEATKGRFILWFFGLSFIWFIILLFLGNAAYDAVAAKRDTLSGWSWGYISSFNAANSARLSVFGWGFLGFPVTAMVAYAVTMAQMANQKAVEQKRQELQAERERLEFEGKVKSLEEETSQQANLSQFAQSKQELIMRLGTIDQYLRVLALETDPSKRTVALQAAHSEMTTLAAKLASGQLSREAIDAPDIREQASETSKDLSSLGLVDDRLNRDIMRMFKLSAT
jgi:hypothetical protein